VTIAPTGTLTGQTGATTTLMGTITNNGTIAQASTGSTTDFILSGSVALNGTGTFQLSNSGNNRIYGNGGDSLTIGSQQTLQGAGQLGINSGGFAFALDNKGTILANQSAGLTVAPTTPVTNEAGAVMEANGGTLALIGTFNNSGLIEGLNGSVVQINGATINGGNLDGQVVNNGSATINGVTINPTGTVTGQNGSSTTLTGTITNNGTIAQASTGSTTDFHIAGNVTLNGNGTYQLSNSANNRIYGTGSDSLTIGNQQTLAGSGQVGINSGGFAFNLTNKGTILANQSTPLTIANGPGSFDNQGQLQANNGATMNISVPFTNEGTIHPINGTINANAGFTGTTGTAEIDAAGTLSIGANSTVGTLTQNGTLAFGTHNITVSTDYNNANFGSGNSFNKLAGVTGTGQIVAAGPSPANMQVITGADVSNGATATPTLALGNVHVGDSTTYQIANQGTTANPSLRGAIQTSVNGGNITPGLLSGSGVTAQNFGPIAPGSSTGNFTVTAASAGSLSGQAIHVANNFGNVPEQTINLTGAAYALASPTVTSSLTPQFNFGVVQVGQTINDPLTIKNVQVASNAAFQEGLSASFGTPSTNFLTTNNGMITNLAPGGTDNSSLVVSLHPTGTGTVSGTVLKPRLRRGD
jgi:hypothetical protein